MRWSILPFTFATYFFMYFEAVRWDTSVYNCYISLINWHFTTMKCPSLSLIIYFILKSFSSDQYSHSVLFMLFVKCIFLHLFNFNLWILIEIISLLDTCNWVLFSFYPFWHFYILLGVFSSVTFNVIIGMCLILSFFSVFKFHPVYFTFPPILSFIDLFEFFSITL